MDSSFTKMWHHYEPLLKALAELFNPFVEIAVHDLEQGKIVALFNTVSRREIGDPSPLHELQISSEKFPDYFAPYYKENWDGRPLKCTSITLRNTLGKPVGLICINADVSFMHEAQRIITTFLSTNENSENPIDIFGGPVESQIDIAIDEFLKQESLSLSNLNRTNKKQLVLFLNQKGILNFKNAAPVIAKKLKISRASVYNYIKDLP